MFFAEQNAWKTTILARHICRNCHVLLECAQWGLEHEPYGVWGGLSPRDRREIRRERGIVMHEPLPLSGVVDGVRRAG